MKKALQISTFLALAAVSLSPATPRSLFANPAIAVALADPGRDRDRAADGRRHPAELVALTGIVPGMRVLDLIPGNGYWTRIFSPLVGPGGRVYAVWPVQYAKLAGSNVRELQRIGRSAHYANVRALVEPDATLSAPEPVDVVWTVQNYHDYADDFMGRSGTAKLARDAFRVLKPGGVFVVVDHASAPGRGLADTEKLHRIDPGAVRREAEEAGFAYLGQSRVLANPADPLDIPVFDKAIRGRTSQFALAFRKPARAVSRR